MQLIRENISLTHLNTFGIEANAKFFVEITSPEDFHALVNDPVYKNHRHFILGGGSNVLFTRDFDGLIIKSSITGIEIKEESEEFVILEAGAGELWHALVMYCVDRNWGGIENLSLIPGTCGAAPMQNIGAYGVEVKDVIENVKGIDLLTGDERTFTKAECLFNYRESVFKQDLKEKYFISSITLRLTKKNHQINTQYGAIEEVLRTHHIDHPTIKDVSNAVISIRQSKLPDPARIGNAGSFFKNPTVLKVSAEELKKQYSLIPLYPIDNQNVKVPAGWLIEQCGWKGKKIGNIGVHAQQALVIVNYGGGKGEEISQLAKQIQHDVHEKFSITLTTEVNII